MAKFMVKKSELKNVCKAVNDRKLAELKKEIIEILKKQDEKDFKKATDYLNSQEEHFTHLEKALSGKWIEKAGYGIGTVRVWKGKKYKKIAPNKWVRVFDKEGRGTNIAIGKLIAKVNKIDNVEDLMAFVMANKQRFVDENGVDLPVLDKLRAAVDAKNTGDIGSKGNESGYADEKIYPNEEAKRTTIENLKNSVKEDKEDLNSVLRTKEQKNRIKERIARNEYAIKYLTDENKGTSKPAEKKTVDYSKMSEDELKELTSKLHDKLREKDYDEVDEEMEQINAISKQQAINFYKTREKHTLQHVEDVEQKKKMIADSKTVTEKELARKEKQKAKETNIAKKNKLVDEVKELKHKISAFEQIAKELDEEKPVEKKKTFKQEMNQLYDAQDEAWEGFESGSDIKSSPENSKKFYERVKKFVDDNNIKLSQKHYDEIEEMNGHSFNEALELAGAYGEEKKEKALAKNREYSKKYKGQILDLSMIDEFKESDDENKTYWVQDSRGNRLTNEDAKSRIIDNNMQIFKLNGSNEPRKDMKIRELKNENEYLMDRLNPEDKAEVEIPDYASKLNSDESRKLTEELERLQEGGESEVEKTQNRSEAMKGNKNAYKGGVTNNPDKLKPIAKAEKIEDGKVKLPYSKEVSDEIKQLTNTSKDAVKKGSRYDFLTKLYYNKGNLVSTDGNKLKIVKVGNLDGIENGTFVDIDNTKEGITITADKDFTESHKFPLYERVIPQDNNEKIVLDNKALISKIRDLKKDGGITTKDSYVTFDIQGNDLMLDGVKVGDVSAANFEGENSDYINFDADILTSYLSGDKTELFSSKDSSKSMYFGNGSILNVIMPQVKTTSRYDSDGKEIKEQRRKDYNSMRKDKEVSDEIKTRSKALRKELNEGYVENIVNGYKRSVPANFEEKSIEKLKEWTTEQLQRMYKVANADIDSLMEKKDFNSDSFSSFCYKNFDMSPHNLIGQNYAMKDHPAIVREIERLVTERGGKLEKSLFDGFLGLELLEEDVDNIEKDREEESLWNDYSAEQPELFNSVELQVCEAMNRHYSNCL